MLLLDPMPQLSPYFAHFTANLWDFFLFFCYIVFCVIVTFRFVQTYRYSKGQYISGMIGCTLIWMYVPVMFTANSIYWIINLCPLPILGVSIIQGYKAWFFYDTDEYEMWVDSQKAEGSPKLGTFGQNTAFGRFVLQPQEELTSWPYRNYRMGLFGVAFLLMWAFGFWKSTENLSVGATIATKTTEQVVEQKVNKVEQKIIGKIEASVDSSAARTRKITSMLDSSDAARQQEYVQTTANVTRSEKKADKASADARRAEAKAERFRLSPVQIVQPAQSIPIGSDKSPEIRTPSRLRGRKTGMMSNSTDSLDNQQLARYDEYDDAND